MITIKIDRETDFIILGVYENGTRKIHSRFPTGDLEDNKINKLKIEAFDLLWTLKELGKKVEINPYTN